MSNQYLKEYLSMTVIGNFHLEAAVAEQLRLAREGRTRRKFTLPLLGSAHRPIRKDQAAPTVMIRVPSEATLMR